MQRKLQRDRGAVLTSDLERLVKALASQIQAAMAALYNLHTALLNVSNPDKPRNSLLVHFKSARDEFRSECERVIAFMQTCHGHADDFIALCEALSLPPTTYLPLAEEVLESARGLHEQVGAIAKTHDRWFKSLIKQKKRLNTELKSTAIPKRRRAPPNHVINQNTSAAQFLEVAQSALHPDGVKALQDSYAALWDISASLKGIVVFWKLHASFCANIAKSGRRNAQPPRLYNVSAATWAHYKSALLATISSISESSDAISVDPIPASVSTTAVAPASPAKLSKQVRLSARPQVRLAAHPAASTNVSAATKPLDVTFGPSVSSSNAFHAFSDVDPTPRNVVLGHATARSLDVAVCPSVPLKDDNYPPSGVVLSLPATQLTDLAISPPVPPKDVKYLPPVVASSLETVTSSTPKSSGHLKEALPITTVTKSLIDPMKANEPPLVPTHSNSTSAAAPSSHAASFSLQRDASTLQVTLPTATSSPSRIPPRKSNSGPRAGWIASPVMSPISMSITSNAERSLNDTARLGPHSEIAKALCIPAFPVLAIAVTTRSPMHPSHMSQELPTSELSGHILPKKKFRDTRQDILRRVPSIFVHKKRGQKDKPGKR